MSPSPKSHPTPPARRASQPPPILPSRSKNTAPTRPASNGRESASISPASPRTRPSSTPGNTRAPRRPLTRRTTAKRATRRRATESLRPPPEPTSSFGWSVPRQEPATGSRSPDRRPPTPRGPTPPARRNRLTCPRGAMRRSRPSSPSPWPTLTPPACRAGAMTSRSGFPATLSAGTSPSTAFGATPRSPR